MKRKLLVTAWVPDEVLSQFADVFEVMAPAEKGAKFTPEEVEARIGEAEALLTLGGYPCRRELIDKGEKLVAVANFGVGYDNIDVPYCTEKGIFVVNTPNNVLQATAEFTVALMMAVARSVPRYDRELKQSRMCSSTAFFDRDMLLYGKVLGILGLGRIGLAVAQKAQGLGMRVIYFDPFRRSEEEENALGVSYAAFDDVFREADVVSCHMPLSDATRGLVGAKQFALMKKTAYFINAARGPVMDEKALAAAVKDGVIRGAAIDVFELEPKVSEELAALDNVVITPHVASCVYEARAGMATEALTGLATVLGGERAPNVVNAQLYDS